MTIETLIGNSKQKTEKNHTSFHLTAHEVKNTVLWPRVPYWYDLLLFSSKILALGHRVQRSFVWIN